MKNFSRKLTSLLASRTFFYVVLGFFIFEAVWFVVSAMYPMPFDEDFHFGVIKIYAEQWSPFLTAQPEGADKFGALVHDPSYLFHYLMSFPYRFISLFTQSEWIQVVFLRFINVALFTWSLVLFRRVLRRAKTSDALINTALALFVLIPVAPQLAAHINYDNLLMVLVAWMFLVTFRLIESFRERRVDMVALLAFVGICLFTSVVKYAALPILGVTALFIAGVAFWSFRGKGKRFLYRVKDDYLRIEQRAKVVLLVVLGIGLVLFAQRYIVNLVQYHHPVPDCGKVLTAEQCKQYGPWGRDYYLEQNKPADFGPNIPWFLDQWWKGMRHRLFFAINGSHASYTNYTELPVPVRTATVIVAVGVLATVIWWRPVFRNNMYYVLFSLVILGYVIILLNDQLSSYKQTAEPVAINGRYLLPIALPLAALMGSGIASGLRKFKAEAAKPFLASIAILLFLHGGGILTFILRSDESWYWPDQTIRNINQSARTIIDPIIYEGDRHAKWD
ncbi:MAG TPA: hypothetical protein VIS56_00285 [Candidatus Saccharimonadales bacterium]